MSRECRTVQVERKRSGQLLLAWRSDHLAFEVVCCTCVQSDVLSNIRARGQPRLSVTRTSVPRHAPLTYCMLYISCKARTAAA